MVYNSLKSCLCRANLTSQGLNFNLNVKLTVGLGKIIIYHCYQIEEGIHSSSCRAKLNTNNPYVKTEQLEVLVIR